MLKYIAKRLGQAVLTLFIIITIIFCLLRMMPEEGYLGANYDKMSELQRETILTEMGLRDPVPVQLAKFYRDLLHGNFGTSWIYRPNVAITEILADKAPVSIRMGLMAIGISLVVGIPLGVLMTRFKGHIPDKLGMAFVVLVMAIPQAVYHLFIQTYLTDALSLPMLFKEANVMSWILPTVSLSLYNTATFALWMRRYMVDELNKDYVRLARAKGVKNSVIMASHVFPNAFRPPWAPSMWNPSTRCRGWGGCWWMSSSGRTTPWSRPWCSSTPPWASWGCCWPAGATNGGSWRSAC